MSTIQDKIAQAKAAGYSDADITSHLAQSPEYADKIKTATAAGYKPEQIVSHLAHKRTTSVGEDGTGLVVFDDGRCTLTPQPGVLLLVATADDTQGLDHVRDVLGRHLERFGGRESLQVSWSEPTG